MKQMRIQRKPRKHAGPGEPTLEALPTAPASDTAPAAATLARIDEVLASR